MPRQKLPDGWEYSPTWNNCIEHTSGWPEVHICTGSFRLDSLESSTEIPPSVALAVIRNAGLDAVYEAAKELLATDDARMMPNLFGKLRKLIESLEEPQDPRAVTECIESLTRDREIRTLAEQQHTTPAELARVTCEADANAGSR